MLGTSYAPLMSSLIWAALPLYSALLGLVAANNPACRPGPSALLPSQGRHARCSFANQLLLVGGSLLLVYCFRGAEGSLVQAQLHLGARSAKLSYLVWGVTGGGLALLLPTISLTALKSGTLALPLWCLGPACGVWWALVPLTTQLTSVLLLLEIIGATLIWALASLQPPRRPTAHGGRGAPGALIYATLLFLWTSGVSALCLLLGIGLTGLGGGLVNFGCPLGLAAHEGGLAVMRDALLALVFTFKFLMGGGQFLLLAWYRFLPGEGLGFYLIFYYPLHLLVGANVLVGFLLPALSLGLVIVVGGAGLALLNLLPHLGAQSSPALTLGGSSFIGLALLGLALLQLV